MLHSIKILHRVRQKSATDLLLTTKNLHVVCFFLGMVFLEDITQKLKLGAVMLSDYRAIIEETLQRLFSKTLQKLEESNKFLSQPALKTQIFANVLYQHLLLLYEMLLFEACTLIFNSYDDEQIGQILCDQNKVLQTQIFARTKKKS